MYSHHCSYRSAQIRSPVTWCITAAAPTASAATQCIRSVETGVPSQSTVYTQPGAPSAPKAAADFSISAVADSSIHSGASPSSAMSAARAWSTRRAHSIQCPIVAP